MHRRSLLFCFLRVNVSGRSGVALLLRHIARLTLALHTRASTTTGRRYSPPTHPSLHFLKGPHSSLPNTATQQPLLPPLQFVMMYGPQLPRVCRLVFGRASDRRGKTPASSSPFKKWTSPHGAVVNHHHRHRQKHRSTTPYITIIHPAFPARAAPHPALFHLSNYSFEPCG